MNTKIFQISLICSMLVVTSVATLAEVTPEQIAKAKAAWGTTVEKLQKDFQRKNLAKDTQARQDAYLRGEKYTPPAPPQARTAPSKADAVGNVPGYQGLVFGENQEETFYKLYLLALNEKEDPYVSFTLNTKRFAVPLSFWTDFQSRLPWDKRGRQYYFVSDILKVSGNTSTITCYFPSIMSETEGIEEESWAHVAHKYDANWGLTLIHVQYHDVELKRLITNFKKHMPDAELTTFSGHLYGNTPHLKINYEFDAIVGKANGATWRLVVGFKYIGTEIDRSVPFSARALKAWNDDWEQGTIFSHKTKRPAKVSASSLNQFIDFFVDDLNAGFANHNPDYGPNYGPARDYSSDGEKVFPLKLPFLLVQSDAHVDAMAEDWIELERSKDEAEKIAEEKGTEQTYGF